MNAKVKEFKVPENMQQYAQEVIDRISYLWPDVAFDLLETSIKATLAVEQDLTNLSRDVRYGLYRAKIRDESKELKRSLYRTVFGS